MPNPKWEDVTFGNSTENIPKWEDVSFDEGKTPSLWKRFKAGFMEKPIPQPEGFERGDVAEFAGAAGLETLGGTLGVPLGPGGVAAGAAAGKATHEAVRRGIGAFRPGTTDMGGGLEQVTGRVAGEAALQGLGAKYLPPITKAVGTGIAATGEFIGKKVLAPLAASTAGLSNEAMEAMIQSPSTVIKHIGIKPEQIAGYAKAFQETVAENVRRAGNAYKEIIENQVRKNPAYLESFKSDFPRVMSDTLKKAREDFGYGIPGRFTNEQEANTFNTLADHIGQKMRNPTAEELYFLQKDLNHLIKQNVGKPLGAAVKQVRTKLMGYLDDKIPEIKEANAIYRTAMELEEDLSKVTNADNAVTIIKSAFKNKTRTGDALLESADKIAGAREAIEGVLKGSAGKEFSPWIRSLPQTGFATGAVGGLGYLGATQPALLPLAIPALSPRAVGYGIAGAVKGSAALGRGVAAAGRIATPTFKYTSPLLISSSEELMRKYYENQK